MTFSGYTPESTNKPAGRKMTSKHQEETVAQVLALPCVGIPERGIDKRTAEHFGIRTALSTQDGLTHEAHYFPYTLEGKIVGFKKRDLLQPKQARGHFTVVGFQSVQCDLFGTMSANKTGGKKVVISEGEYDAAITWQVMKAKYPQGNPAVLSIGNGTSNAVQNIGQKHNLKTLSKFSEIILAFDADRATSAEKEKKIMKGKEATAAVYGLLPDAKVADFPDNYDPCDMFKEGLMDQLYWSVMKPIEYVPEGFRTYDQFRDKAHELPKLGRSWPWAAMTKATLGRRDGEGYYIGSGVKMGKSELLNQLAEHIIKVDKRKPALFKFEEENDVTCKKIAGKLHHKDFINAEKVIYIHGENDLRDIWGNPIDPTNRGYFTQQELIDATDEIGDQIIYYSNYGRANWDEVKGAIRHAVLVEGCKDVFLDPITRLTQGMTASEANTELERFSDEISKMSKDLGFTYYCFCHLNKPESGKPHEFGGVPQSAQFTGSRAMMRNTYYMIGLQRNKDPELSMKERNTSYLIVLDDRKHGRSAKIPLFYDIDTGDYLEPPEGFLEGSYETLAEYYEVNPKGAKASDF